MMSRRRSQSTVGDEGKRNPAEQACKKRACDIQRCLSRNNNQQSACAEEIEMWESCVRRVEARLKPEDSAGTGESASGVADPAGS